MFVAHWVLYLLHQTSGGYKDMAHHGIASRLARSAALSANLLGGIGNSCVVRIFSMTLSIKKLKICSSLSSVLMNFSSGSTRITSFGKTSCQQTMSTQHR
jgi:hypothetical protein